MPKTGGAVPKTGGTVPKTGGAVPKAAAGPVPKMNGAGPIPKNPTPRQYAPGPKSEPEPNKYKKKAQKKKRRTRVAPAERPQQKSCRPKPWSCQRGYRTNFREIPHKQPEEPGKEDDRNSTKNTYTCKGNTAQP